MIRIGLTGPTGAGKGALSQIFEKHGIPCLDTDKVSRLVCAPGEPCTQKLAEEFGSDLLDKNGVLDRKLLASRVFCAPDRDERLKRLNTITHKYILDYADKWLCEKEKAGFAAAVVDAPVLFESGYDKKCDYIIGVLAGKSTRIERITGRDNIGCEEAEKRIAAQKDDEFFIKSCSLVIYNDSSENELENKALPYIKALLNGVIPI
jgi:dephospho-CoA kinase